MPDNPPARLKVNKVDDISPKGGQKLNVTNEQGQNFDLYLTKKSEKLTPGSMGNILAEIWQYETPKHEWIWCGNLVKTPQSTPNNAPQPAQATNSPQQDQLAIENRQKAGLCAAHAIKGIAFDNHMEISVKILDIAAPLAEWFMTGRAPNMNSFDQFAKNNPVENDDIPY